MAKVAVSSTDGISINQHFGKSQEFLIYEVQDTGEYEFIERRSNDVPNSLATGHHGAKIQLISDVEVVLTAQIGPGAEQELRHQGIIALTVTGPIDKALHTYGKRAKFLRNSISRSCRPGGLSHCSCSQGC